MGTMISRKLREMTDDDIGVVTAAFNAFRKGKQKDAPGFFAVASIDDIAAQDFILTPGRYVGPEDKVEDDESFDEKMKRLTNEISTLFERSHGLEKTIRHHLRSIGYEI